MPHLAPDEYGAFYAGYIDRVAGPASVTDVLAEQTPGVEAFLRAIPSDRAGHRYAEGKWSVREVIGHLTDTERIMAYRALRIARGDTAPLPGFDEDAYVAAASFDAQPLATLIETWSAVRLTTLQLFRSFDDDALQRRGTASGHPTSVRALGCIIAGHEQHHVEILQTRYGLAPA